jgi:hypothetical protein
MRNLSLSILAAGAAMLSSGALAQAGPPAGHAMPGGMMMRQMGPMAGQHFQRRLQRGFIVPRFFWGPQFQINNWQMYGFADPGPDGRWIRYYDDAYLIDHDGRIRDSREGLDWDRYGEQWEMADGIPAYRGSRAYRPGREDEEWAEAHEGHMRHGEMGEMREMHMRREGPPMMGPPMGAGYGGSYTQVYGGGGGYGAYAYPIVIETTTTTGGGESYREEVIEEYRTVHRARHHVRPRCLCQAPRTVVRYVPHTVVRYVRPPRPVHHAPPPRPRPPAGERG